MPLTVVRSAVELTTQYLEHSYLWWAGCDLNTQCFLCHRFTVCLLRRLHTYPLWWLVPDSNRNPRCFRPLHRPTLLTSHLAPYARFERASPFRPMLFKSTPSPPGHTALVPLGKSKG